MPPKIKRVGSKYQVTEPVTGKVLGTHDSRGEALKQVQAVESKRKKKKLGKNIRGFMKRKR